MTETCQNKEVLQQESKTNQSYHNICFHVKQLYDPLQFTQHSTAQPPEPQKLRLQAVSGQTQITLTQEH